MIYLFRDIEDKKHILLQVTDNKETIMMWRRNGQIRVTSILKPKAYHFNKKKTHCISTVYIHTYTYNSNLKLQTL